MNNNIMKFGYEDTDKKIEVELYGLVFEINKEKIVEKDVKKIEENDEILIKNEIEDVIGEGAIEKINNKRKLDGYKEMTLDVEIAVLTCIYKAYINATAGGMMDGIQEQQNEIINRNNYNYRPNRQRRRKNNRYRRY